jgi:cytochrome c oxidase cbb3-type subunit 1
VFLGYLMIAVWGALTFHQRRERQLFVSQWFLFAALFWFPWVYSTVDLLLFTFRVRGMAQAVIAWWYTDNLLVVWLGLVGLAGVFYFLPKLTGRELHSRYLALLTFWMLILFGSWGGVPESAPVPAWLPVSGAVAKGLGVIGIVAVALNVHGTLGGQWSKLMAHPSLRFIGFGLVAFIVGGVVSAVGALPEVSNVTHFTWFTVARDLLNYYGFFAMVMFGAIYYIVPQLLGFEFPSAKPVRAHFWTAASGIVLFVVPLAAGGIVQGLKLRQADIPFTDIARGTLPFLRVSTMGDLLIALGHLMFLSNLVGLVVRFYRARAVSAWASATAEIKPAEATP